MDRLLQTLTEKKKQLDDYRPLPPAVVKNLDEWFKVELTYSSNAIEGNTLTRVETAAVVEKGLTIRGKSLKEHLEAINYAYALDFIKTLVGKKRTDTTNDDICAIHKLVLTRIEDEYAGVWRTVPVRIAGSSVVTPNWAKVPQLMDQFITWLHTTTEHPVRVAAEAHLRLVTIHPFVDGNGRTARLLMNLLSIQEGYPPAIILPDDRIEYINAIEKAQLNEQFDDYYHIIYQAEDKSLDIYLEAARAL